MGPIFFIKNVGDYEAFKVGIILIMLKLIRSLFSCQNLSFTLPLSRPLSAYGKRQTFHIKMILSMNCLQKVWNSSFHVSMNSFARLSTKCLEWSKWTIRTPKNLSVTLQCTKEENEHCQNDKDSFLLWHPYTISAGLSHCSWSFEHQTLTTIIMSTLIDGLILMDRLLSTFFEQNWGLTY